MFDWDRKWYEGNGPIEQQGDWKETLKTHRVEAGLVAALIVVCLVWWGVA